MSGADQPVRVTMASRVGRLKGHSFLALPPSARVVDLGLNQGAFASAMAAVYAAEIVGCEPHPVLAEKVRALGIDRLVVHETAVTAESGTIDLFLNETHCATVRPSLREKAAGSVQVRAMTFQQFVDEAIAATWGEAAVDLLKIDIEAAEIPLLLETPASTLQRFKQITVEFHDFVDAGLLADVERAKARLREAGFTELRFTLNNEDVLFLNDAWYQVPRHVRLALIARFRVLRGARRRMRRYLTGVEPRDRVPRQ